MNKTTRWAEELKDTVEVARTLRDELKVQLHLGNMEARARFETLETRLENEGLKARHAFQEMVEGFRGVQKELQTPAKKK